MTTQRDMLATCRDQFAMYAQNHRLKATGFQNTINLLDPVEDADQIENLTAAVVDTTRKAEENERLCREVQSVLDQEEGDVLRRTAQFGQIAYADGISEKNRQTQIGVHFEEVAEMVEELGSDDITTQAKIMVAADALEDLGNHLKNSEPGLLRIFDRERFLDSICDQLVTGTLTAVLNGMDPVGGLIEVNRSNYSKLVDGVMQKAPITAKWIKGPNFSEPDLSPYI